MAEYLTTGIDWNKDLMYAIQLDADVRGAEKHLSLGGSKRVKALCSDDGPEDTLP